MSGKYEQHKLITCSERQRERIVAEAPHTDSHDDTWKHMTPAHQQKLKGEDSEAWKQVVGVLLFIISIGLVLAVGTALLSGIMSRNL